MPKQFVKLFDDKSLFQLTIERNSKVCDSQFIVSNTEQYFLALDQLEELQEIPNQVGNDESRRVGNVRSKYLLEPVGRNTAPAIALACMVLDPDELVLVTPSDHLIKDEVEYEKVLQKAKELAEENNLVTFGITPSFAETGFGYIEAEDFNIRAFHEKPDFKTATKYLEAGNYYWNSGMFMFRAGVFLEELEKYSTEIYVACRDALKDSRVKHENDGNVKHENDGNVKHENDGNVKHEDCVIDTIVIPDSDRESNLIRIKHEDMLAIPEDSIDFAVMEKSNKVKVVPSNIKWSDVGSFDSLYDELPKDENNNTTSEKYIQVDSKNNLIYGSDRYIATVDVNDMIIVDTGDALLISKKGSSQKVKQVVNEIKKTTELHNIHLTGHRPYTILEESNGYKIKRIEVKPGKRLSLQRHKHRNEHWIVASGKARVTINDDVFTLDENESTYIKAGDIHRLLNDTKLPLVIIEAQVGSYTGEDDIERLEDDYER
jgi:mannose-1-phosphate guanylyltransferase